MLLANARTASIVVGLVALAIVWLVFRHNVNWDEFHYLSMVHRYVNGDPLPPLQTFHVHLFGWVTALSGDEMVQVTAARSVVAALLLCTTALVYATARAFVAARFALLGSLAFLASGFVVGHGASFRPDPIAACLLMTALYIGFASRLTRWQIALAALGVAVAGLVTIKAVLFAPAFVAVLVHRWGERHLPVKALSAIVTTGALYLALLSAHHALLVENGGDAVDAATRAVRATVLAGELVPRASTVSMWGILSAGSLPLVLAGLVGGRRRALVCALLVCPILSVLFYRNAYPYFFPFIAPPLMIVAAIGARSLARRKGALGLAMMLMSASAGSQVWMSAGEDQRVQSETIALVHRVFPDPVPYIDFNAMIASFPKVGFFMSSWGLDNYRRAGVPVFEDIIASHAPPLLLTNGGALSAAMFGFDEYSRRHGLFEADVAALRRNYVRYWRDVWLAGRSFEVDEHALLFEITIPGTYRVDAKESVVIDGVTVEPGQVIDLAGGTHTVSSSTAQDLTMMWSVPPPPKKPTSYPPLYYGFWKI